MIKALKERGLIERFEDDLVSGGFKARIDGKWRTFEKQVCLLYHYRVSHLVSNLGWVNFDL